LPWLKTCRSLGTFALVYEAPRFPLPPRLQFLAESGENVETGQPAGNAAGAAAIRREPETKR
jgi:hypothetical protein